jgi:hypothetical protein
MWYHAILQKDTNVSEECAALLCRIFSALKMETAYFSEMLVPIYCTTQYHIPEDSNLCIQYLEASNLTLTFKRRSFNMVVA